MRFWHDFLDSVGSEGGIILVLMFLIFVPSKLGIPKAEDITIGAFGALLGLMQKRGSNKEQRDTATAIQSIEIPAKEP